MIEYSDPMLPVCEKISQEFNLVKNCFDESDEIKILTKISCNTVHDEEGDDDDDDDDETINWRRD